MLSPLRSNLTLIRSVLAAKVSRVRGLMDEIGVGATVSSLSHHWVEVRKSSLNSGNDENHDSHIQGSQSSPIPDTQNGPSEGKDKGGLDGSADKIKMEKGANEDAKHDDKMEGERKLLELAFDLHCALQPLQDSRRNRLLMGDDVITAPAYSNTSETCPSNNFRILIETNSEKESNGSDKNISKSSNSKDDSAEAVSRRKSLSAYSLYGGVSVRNEARRKENESELINFPTLTTLYSSNRWGICGFQVGNPLKDFQSNGLLALKNLTEFLLRYEEAGCQLGADFAEQRSRYCTYAQVAVQLSKFTADALRLTPTPYTPLSAPIQHLAKQHSWQLLSEQNCFQELFNLAMLTFDEAWRAVTEERGTLPHVGTYDQCLLYVRETLDTIVKTVSPL